MDRMAEGYARWWAPVIRPAALRVLDLVAPAVDAGARELLDVGTGTGTLAIGAVERWAGVQATGIDASREMIQGARAAARASLGASDRRRYRTKVAFADELPFDDASFDVAVSSFVLQLVPSRAATLREVRRVLRPGSTFGWVTWLRGEIRFAPDLVADEVLDDAGFDPPDGGGPNGDVASVAAAADAMRRAGFRDVHASEGVVDQAWNARGYLGFLTEFDEASLFDDLDPGERAEIEGRLLERLEALTVAELTLRLPIVYVTGTSA